VLLPMPDESDFRTLSRQQYFEIVSEQIQHEDELINQRLSWLITGESIFFGFYAQILATAASNPKTFGITLTHVRIIGWVAFITCLLIYLSVLAAVWNLSLLRKQLDGFCSFSEDGRICPIPNVMPGHWPIRYLGLVAPIVIPVVFMLAWMILMNITLQ
jgi:hypothetical protein